MSKLINDNKLIIICFIIMLGSIIISGVSVSGQRSDLDDLNETISSLESVSGLDSLRVESDTKIISDLLGVATTWNDSDEYIAQRNSLKVDYSLDEDSQFLKTFISELVPYPDLDGNVKYEIDINNLSSKFRDINPYVTNISNDEYTYFAEVEIQSKSGKYRKVKSTFLITYTINSDGEVININAFNKGF